MEGWIKMHRSILEHWIWNEKPFSRGQAWMDLLLLVNHDDKKTMLNGELITIRRGEHITSVLKLSNRWGWGRKKVSKFLDDLETERMITQERTTQRTAITIVKYEVYQSKEQQEEQQKNSVGTAEEQPRNTNKNVKNDKNEKKKNTIVEQGPSEYQYKDVIDYLNMISGKAFKDKSKDTRKHIKARFDEGFSFDDFKRVVDVKCAEWIGTDMDAYVRPSTLFGTKFESYLNQAPKHAKAQQKNEWEEFMNE